MQILRPLLLLSLALPVFAQQPPTPVPATQPAAPVPAPATPAVPGDASLLPPPATPAPPSLGPFKDIKERHSYGLGIFLGNREKNTAANSPEKTTLNNSDVLAGLQQGLSGEKSIDYAAGLAMAAQIKRSGVEIDRAVLIEAVRSSLEGKEEKVPSAEVQVIMQEIQKSIKEREDARKKAEAEKNLAESTVWMTENAKKEGVKSSPSGLQYIIKNPGEGKPPGDKDLVTVNLSGKTVDGSEFDKSQPNVPARRSLAALPKGLQEGILMLKPGGKATFWVPPVLGYGDSPRGAALKANSVLHYEIELISSEVPPAPQPGTAGQQPRRPVSAVTPPVSVDIPAAPGAAPRIRPGQAVTPPVQVPPATPPAPRVAPIPPVPPAPPAPPAPGEPAPAPAPAK